MVIRIFAALVLALALACPAQAQTKPGATARAIANAAGSLGVSASPTLLGPLTTGANLAGGLPVLSAVPTAGDCLLWSGAGIADGGACQAALGFTPLAPANNLSDLASAAAAAINLGVAKGIDPRSAPYNAKCDGVTDDTVAWNAAAVAAYAAGVPIVMPPAVCYVAAGSNAHLPSVTGHARMGYSANPTTEPYTLLLGPYTLAPQNGATLWPGVTVDGIRVLRAGFVQPTSLRTAISTAAAFSGTAFTLGTTSDVTLRNVFIEGFAQLVTKAGSRDDLFNVSGDGTAGFQDTSCGDSCMMANIEAFPYASFGAGAGAGKQYQISTISAVASGTANVCAVTLSAVPATPIITGDTVVIYAPGTTGCNGRQTVTATDTTHFTLNGTTFGGTYTTGGTAFLTSVLRTGAAFEEIGNGSDWIINASEFDFDTGIHVGGTAYAVVIDGFWSDGYAGNGTDYDTIPTNLKVDGTASNDAKISNFRFGGKTNAVVNSSATSHLLLTNGSLSVNSYTTQGSGLLLTGGTTIVNNAYVATNGTYGSTSESWASISDATTSVLLSNINFGTGFASAIYYPGTAACGTTFMDGTAGPCPWTPSVYGHTTAGTIVYSARQGSYWVSTAGLVTAQAFASPTSWSPAPSGAIYMTLPFAGTSNSYLGSCALGAFDGWTAPTNYGSVGAKLQWDGTNSKNAIQFLKNSTNGGAAVGAQVSELTLANFDAAVTCSYKQ